VSPHNLRGWVPPESRGRAPHTGTRLGGSGTFAGLRPEVLLEHLPAVYDQGQVGSCTAHALAGAVEILLARGGYTPETLDRAALYRRERDAIGTPTEDSGAILADGVRLLGAGWEPEALPPPGTWGTVWTRSAPQLAPDAPRLVNSEPLDFDPETIATELDAGHVVLAGIHVTAQWSEAWGAESLPEPSGRVVGGHAVALVGYSLPRRAWVVRNSWGAAWGRGGCALLPWRWTELPWCGELHAARAVRRAPPPPPVRVTSADKVEALQDFLRPIATLPARELAALGIEHDPALRLPRKAS